MTGETLTTAIDYDAAVNGDAHAVEIDGLPLKIAVTPA